MSATGHEEGTQTSNSGDTRIFRYDMRERDWWGPNSVAWKLAHWLSLIVWLGIALYLVRMLRDFHQHMLGNL